MRKFEKVTLEQYMKDGGTQDEYDAIVLPQRATVKSGCYDIRTPKGFVLGPKNSARFPTGLRVLMNDDESLLVHVRSSVGAKYKVRLSNCTGIIDADYCLGSNEGHMWVFLHNDSDIHFVANAGDRIAQGMFVKYLTTDDDSVDSERTGGIGSTGK